MFVKLPDDSPVREVFLLEPQHKGFLRGKPAQLIPPERMKNNNPAYLVLIGLFLLLMSFIFGCHLVSTFADIALLQQFGIETEGRIVEKWSETPFNDDIRYYVTSEYAVGNQHFRHKQEIQRATFAQLHEGGAVSIRYVQNVPGTSRMSESIDRNQVIFLALCVVFIPLGIVSIRKAHSITTNDRKLAELGSILLGKITQIDGTVSFGRWYNAEISYEFASPHGHGRPIAGRAFKLSMPLITGGTPAIGTRVAVLYVNDHLFQML